MRLKCLAVLMMLVPALAAAQPYTFVSTPADGSLAVIDLASNTAVATVPLTGLPIGCAVGPRGARLYAALSQSNDLAVIDMASGSVTQVPVGTAPSGVAVDGVGRRVYVANTGSDTVSVVDPRRAALVATIPVGFAPFDLVASGRHLYVANWGGKSVSVVDLDANAVVATIRVGTMPGGLAFHRLSRRLYVTNFFDGTVSVVDTRTLSVVSTIPVGKSPRGLAVDASGDRLFVAGFDGSTVKVIDAHTGGLVLEAPSGGLNPLDLMLGPDGTRLYVSHFQETQGVAVLDAATLAPLGTVNVPAGPILFAGVSPLSPPPATVASRWMDAARGAVQAWRGSAPPPAMAPARSRTSSMGGDFVVSDSDFNLADWTVTGGPQTTTQQVEGGNPGSWRATTHLSSPNTVITRHTLVRPGTLYDPIEMGAIASIDATWDRRRLSGVLIGERFCVYQDNVAYCTWPLDLFASAQWEHVSRLGLEPSDFDDGNGGQPDFSFTAPPLRFGYLRDTGAGEPSLSHGIDNFVVTVHPGAVNTAGRIGFDTWAGMTGPSQVATIVLQRTVGTLGAVAADVRIENPDGTITIRNVSWADGDNAAKTIQVAFQLVGNSAATAKLTLVNPAGGATINSDEAEMTVIVIPDDIPSDLQALVGSLAVLMAGVSPAWLLLLAPAALLAARRRRA